MCGISRALAVALMVGVGSAPAESGPAPTPIGQSPLYVIVPFGEPGDTDPVLADSTKQFSEDLSDRRVRSALGTPTDAVEAVSNARTICEQYNAAGILVSEIRFSQTKNFNVPQFVAGFVPYVGGAIAGASAFDRVPIHAQYKLFLVDCRGKVQWRTITTAEKVHHGANVAAGLTEISFKAIERAADEFAARRTQAR
jgi:hypothetical protein